MTRPAPLAGAGRLAGAAALIAVLTVASRLAGFGRTAVFTWVVEQSDLGGMYVIANTVPNIVFEIVAGGALASLVVPLLAGAVAAEDRRAVAATTGALLTWTVSLLVPLAVLVVLFADPIISLISEGRSAAELAAGARMLRVFAPQLPLYGIGIVLTGVLQAHRRFAWPVIAPLLSSLTVVVVYVAFGAAQGRGVSVAQVGRSGELLLSGGTTLGVVVLSLSLLIPLRGLRVRPRFGYAFTADARARIGGLATAGAVTVAAQQVALLVVLNRVSGGPTGSPQVFNLAQAIYLLPWAVLAVPLAVASYPTLATASAAGDEDGYRRTLSGTVRGVLLFSCLGVAALIGTAQPIAALFYPDNPASTAAAISGFAPGLLGYGLFAVLSRALYARGDTRSATVAITLGWLVVPAVALPLTALLPTTDRVLAVTSANSVGMLVLGALLLLAVLRSAGRSALAGAARAGAAGGLAGLLAGLAGWGLTRWLATPDDTPTMAAAFGQGMLSGVLVGVVFLAVVWFVDRRDVQPLLAGVLRRLGRRGPSGDAPTPGAGSAERGDGKETAAR